MRLTNLIQKIKNVKGYLVKEKLKKHLETLFHLTSETRGY